MDLGVAVLASLGGGHLHDLAGPVLRDHSDYFDDGDYDDDDDDGDDGDDDDGDDDDPNNSREVKLLEQAWATDEVVQES